METSVPHMAAEVARSGSSPSLTLRPTAASEAPARVPGRRGDLAVTNELASDLPVSDAERQLFAAYLGDLIQQILQVSTAH